MYKIMTHIVAGYPSVEESEALALSMLEHVDYLEIQIPFSDPVADGPVIAAANHEALASGMKLEDSFALMERVAAQTNKPLFFMTYANIPFVYGMEAFCLRAKEAGATGLIIPDIPYDQEAEMGYIAACEKAGIQTVQVVSPLTKEDRLKAIGKISKPMVYCVAGSGTTGSAREFGPELGAYLDRVRTYTDQPLALGFGISDRAQMDQVGAMADIVVIGSEIIRRYEKGGLESVEALLKF